MYFEYFIEVQLNLNNHGLFQQNVTFLKDFMEKNNIDIIAMSL